MIEYQVRLAKFIEKGIQEVGGNSESVPVLLLALVGWGGWLKTWAVLQEAPFKSRCLEDVIADELGIPRDLAWTVRSLNHYGLGPSKVASMLRDGHLGRRQSRLFYFTLRLIQPFRQHFRFFLLPGR